MTVVGKMATLTENAKAFNRNSERELDEIAAKIQIALKKINEASARHHAYYDSVLKEIDESIAAMDRLSNGPLDGSSGT